MVRQVQPLRISKSNSTSSHASATSPDKMAAPRPLAELGQGSPRRNSPSYNQATRKMIVSREPSPFNPTEMSSPPSDKGSPRTFWTGRENTMSPFRFDENTPDRSPSPAASPRRRPSVEKLMQAGRVKSSNIFALETKDVYDPDSVPIVERPTANRPLSQQLMNNSFTRFDSFRKENNPMRSPHRSQGHKRSETEISLPTFSPTQVPLPDSPEKQQQSSPSPTKSSLARTSMFAASPPPSFNLESANRSDDEPMGAATPRALHRNNKSVTFQADPPVVQEYEQRTPEPSVSVGSREGSWDSDEFYDQDVSFERGSSAEAQDRSGFSEGDDSFDDDLENADKTPVVLPEHWSRMSPDEARRDLVNQEDDVFDETPSPSPQRPILGRSESVTSDGGSRPLPAIPGGFAAQAERASLAARNLPAPARRQSEIEHGSVEDAPITTGDTDEKQDILVRVAEAPLQDDEEGEDSYVADLADLDYVPPRISRESILKKVRGSKYDFEDNDDDEEEPSMLEGEETQRPTYEELARMDPDQPIPSRENSRKISDSCDQRSPVAPQRDQDAEVDDVGIKQEPLDDEEANVDLNAIPEVSVSGQVEHERSPSRMDDYIRDSSVLHHQPQPFQEHQHVRQSPARSESEDENENSSRYSSTEPEAESTVLHNTQIEVAEEEEGKETLDEAMQLLTVKDYSEVIGEVTDATTGQQMNGEFKADSEQKSLPATRSFMGLPTYLSTDDYDFGMGKYITPSPPAAKDENKNPLETIPGPHLALPAELHENGSSVPNGDRKDLLEATQVPHLAPPTKLHEAFESAPVLPPSTEAEDQISPPGTPDSVVHNSRTSDVSSLDPPEQLGENAEEEMYPEPELPEIPHIPDIPERRSTIKTGGKLRSRPSATPADYEMMAQQRRMISLEHPVPPIPGQYQTAEDESERPNTASSSEVSERSGKANFHADHQPTLGRRASRRQSRRMRIDMPQLQGLEADDLGMGMEKEFERVLESQKVGTTLSIPPPHLATPGGGDCVYGAAPLGEYAEANMPSSPFSPQSRAGANGRSQKGYMTRQNTKVVVASNRNISGESSATAKSGESGNSGPMSPNSGLRSTSSRRSSTRSPRKPSGEQYLKTEPWNGKQRRRSVRNASAQKALGEPAPPLPGHESALGVVAEDFAMTGPSDEVDDSVERGRLFVKVVGVKDLDLPMPRNDRVYFQLTLDNGMHCVTTTSLELGKNASIGQEFELVVQSDLEFQLTLTTKLPPPPRVETPTTSMRGGATSPTKSTKSTQSAFSRLLSSPKKRAERERVEREAAEAEERRAREEAQRLRARRQPTTWDLLHELVNGSDGSFARAYINLKAHEQGCYGRQLTVDVPCYNEWALEKDSHVVNSVRSKRGTHAGPIRKPPYVIGKLELQLLYVPKPKGAGDEDMPKSMGSAVREMGKAKEVKEIVHEGCLSQQGGDCTHWRRRFFRLQNSRLTAYHEHTHQKRAVINLAKASRLVDDKSMLVADPTSGNPGSSKGRRRSAFAEEDEGYQYVEEGFRIRFANGETIDFYADSRALKEEWMDALSQVIGKKMDEPDKKSKWTDLVLAREKKLAALAAAGEQDVDAIRLSDVSSVPSSQMSRASSTATKTIAVPQTTRSAAPSPSKGPPEYAPPPPPPAKTQEEPVPRSQTPPMSARRGHRARDAVKSMIF